MTLEADISKLSMEEVVEHEICANCKKEIPQCNYVMHTAHCARNITLCPICKTPIPKNQFEQHRKTHKTNGISEQKPNVRKIQETVDFPRQISKTSNSSKLVQMKSPIGESSNKSVVSNGAISRNLGATKKLVESDKKTEGFSLGEPGSKLKARRELSQVNENSVRKVEEKKSTREANLDFFPQKSNKDGLLACKFCDLELPKLDLEEHENYCGSRTDKCNVCGELVMFKYKKLHEESNHGFLKLKDEPGPRASWDSDTQRAAEITPIRRERPPPIYTVNSIDFSPLYRSYSHDYNLPSENDKKETYKDISRRLDCKTEYIRNLLHDSASITVPLRRSGIAPRNHFNHTKGQAPQPPQRRPNPPTELTIPCEFCNTPIPHDDLIQHETGCRPDLARFNPKRRSASPGDDFYNYPEEPQSPEVELPCEFCSDMFPASQLLRHQLSCN